MADRLRYRRQDAGLPELQPVEVKQVAVQPQASEAAVVLAPEQRKAAEVAQAVLEEEAVLQVATQLELVLEPVQRVELAAVLEQEVELVPPERVLQQVEAAGVELAVREVQVVRQAEAGVLVEVRVQVPQLLEPAPVELPTHLVVPELAVEQVVVLVVDRLPAAVHLSEHQRLDRS
jgi:hypothetical protein